MTKITGLDVVDWRFPTSIRSDGSDAVHKDPDYSCVYVTLTTDTELVGYGLTFTLGRGNEIVAAMCRSLAFLVVGKSLEDDILADMMGFSRSLTQDGQLRWIGPEKGVLAMACGAVINAVWDMWARREGKPLWELVVDLEPEQLVELIDFKHITDVVTKAEALDLLRKRRPAAMGRKAEMKAEGFPAYTTSAGWLGYPEQKIRALCKDLLKEGHRYFKMKVGSADPAEDVVRARAIREEIGPDCVLMMDANQKWDVPEAIANMKRLAEFKPLWIEEPTNCDDVIGHRVIAGALKPLGVGVATGEVAQNKVIFKQLLQPLHEAVGDKLPPIEFCQIDSCRTAGPSEILSVLLMAAKYDIKVCPHAGGVGLCEYVRHLSMIDYCCFAKELKGRICESTTHLHEFFEDEVAFQTDKSGHIRYAAPVAPGFAKFKPSALDVWCFPEGEGWSEPAKVLGISEPTPALDTVLKGLAAKAASAAASERAHAEEVLKRRRVS